MNLNELDQHHWETGDRIAVIETPKHSRVKIDYDPKREIFHLHHALPEGLSFPFDFGFIPGTKAADGDALDVAILMDEPGFPGLVTAIQLLGAFEAEQTEKGKTFRNDRLVARAIESRNFTTINTIEDLPAKTLDQYEEFFVFYNRLRGKSFCPLRRSGPEKAEELVREASHASVEPAPSA